MLGAIFAEPVFPAPVSAGRAVATSRTAPSVVYEDDGVRIPIPAGWRRASGGYPSLEPYRKDRHVVVGNSASEAERSLLLQQDGYTLALAYRTAHASGSVGGRFIEAFEIPWLDPQKAWEDSSGLLMPVPEPASRTLLFHNLLIDTGSAKVRAGCGIPRSLATWVGEGVDKRLVGERRWYAGYLSPDQGYFFGEADERYAARLYSLTSSARHPLELPAAEDSLLAKIIGESHRHCGLNRIQTVRSEFLSAALMRRLLERKAVTLM